MNQNYNRNYSNSNDYYKKDKPYRDNYNNTRREHRDQRDREDYKNQRRNSYYGDRDHKYNHKEYDKYREENKYSNNYNYEKESREMRNEPKETENMQVIDEKNYDSGSSYDFDQEDYPLDLKFKENQKSSSGEKKQNNVNGKYDGNLGLSNFNPNNLEDESYENFRPNSYGKIQENNKLNKFNSLNNISVLSNNLSNLNSTNQSQLLGKKQKKPELIIKPYEKSAEELKAEEITKNFFASFKKGNSQIIRILPKECDLQFDGKELCKLTITASKPNKKEHLFQVSDRFLFNHFSPELINKLSSLEESYSLKEHEDFPIQDNDLLMSFKSGCLLLLEEAIPNYSIADVDQLSKKGYFNPGRKYLMVSYYYSCIVRNTDNKAFVLLELSDILIDSIRKSVRNSIEIENYKSLSNVLGINKEGK